MYEDAAAMSSYSEDYPLVSLASGPAGNQYSVQVGFYILIKHDKFQFLPIWFHSVFDVECLW